MTIPIPDNPWDGEVFRRRQAGEDEDAVRIEVFGRYLDSGDPRPLVDSIDRQRPIPAAIQRRIAAMLDARCSQIVNEPIKWRILIEVGPKRGRPPARLTKDNTGIIRALCNGVEDIASGRDPDGGFWRYLSLGFRCDSRIRAPGMPSPEFPVTLRMTRPGKRGGVLKPDKYEQELALASAVAHATKCAESVSERQIVKTLRKVADENGVSFETVRAAYYNSLK
jgi:hypothetical protein